MSDEATIRNAQRAHVEYQQLEASFDAVKAAIVEELISTPPMQGDKIARLHMAAQNLAAVKEALLQVAQSGDVAKYAIALAGLTRP